MSCLASAPLIVVSGNRSGSGPVRRLANETHSAILVQRHRIKIECSCRRTSLMGQFSQGADSSQSTD